MAASRLLGAAAACAILLNCCLLQLVIINRFGVAASRLQVICQQGFSILALAIFLLKFLLESASKLSFFPFGVEIRFWSAISDAVARSSIAFRNSVFADRIRQGCLVPRLH